MKLQLCRAYGAKYIALPLAIVVLCLFGQALSSQYDIFRELQAALLSVQWVLLGCWAIWCGTFLFLMFSRKDWPLIGLLLIAIVMYFIGYTESWLATDAAILLAGVTLGKGTRFALKADSRWKIENGKTNSEIVNRKSAIVNLLVGLIGLLAFSSWWHLEMKNHCYLGPRWMGLWNNPNIYGMLMGTGVTLAIGLRAGMMKDECRMKNSGKKQKTESGKMFLRLLRFFAAIKSAIRNPQSAILLVAVGMMGVGLVMSYSRGAWVATTIGLLYLAWSHGKVKWRYVVIGVGCVALGAGLLWGRTPDNAPWYIKRMDFGRPSAQHRVSAWRGAVQMMRDHPLGVGWNNAVSIYEKNYSPPENGAAALTTNDYLMLGTELGLPGLFCFISYVALRLRSPKPKVQSPKSVNDATLDIGHWTLDSPQVACRAGAIVLLVAFWFDGGLFDLPTAAVFWVLLELAQMRNMACGVRDAETGQKMEVGSWKIETKQQKLETGQKSAIENRQLAMSGFTLIELLVVVAIMGILAALRLPVLAAAKKRGGQAVCSNNLKPLGTGMKIYVDDRRNGGGWRTSWRGDHFLGMADCQF
jgi:prepilin-type N-terminal cleavage/methylation domain-containing protein